MHETNRFRSYYKLQQSIATHLKSDKHKLQLQNRPIYILC